MAASARCWLLGGECILLIPTDIESLVPHFQRSVPWVHMPPFAYPPRQDKDTSCSPPWVIWLMLSTPRCDHYISTAAHDSLGCYGNDLQA